MPQCVVLSQARQEVYNFFQGVVESFGVSFVLSSTLLDKRRGRDGAEATDTQVKSTPPSFSSTPLADVTERDPAEGSPPSAPIAGPSEPLLRTAVIPGTNSDALCLARTFLMPSWSLLERDPKLWMLLRKNLLANVALAAVTLVYVGLSHCLASSTSLSQKGMAVGGATATSASLSADIPSQSGGASTKSVMTSLVYLLLFLWVRLSLWMFKYVGQWPFYTLLQIIGLIWFNQLYRETWLVRKGWVLRGTELRESPTTESPRGNTGASGGGDVSVSPRGSPTSQPPPPFIAVGAVVPWLSPIPLYSATDGSGNGESGTCNEAQEFFSSIRVMSRALLCSVLPYLRHTTNTAWRMITHKGPTTVLQDWVLGDSSKAAAPFPRHHHAQGGSAASQHQPQPISASPDLFAAVVLQLESISEILFKALATMSFAVFASTIERLPLIGTLISAVLNAQLYAFYVFDYRYAAQQQPNGLHRRGSALTYQLRHFEQCWMYYAGYGMGSAVLSLWLTRQLGTIVSVCAMSVLYSWQVVWSGFAVPLPSSRPVPLFSVWFYAVDMTQRHYAVIWRMAVIAALLYLPFDCVCELLRSGM
ncbi:hypothetical protein JKF63_00552 [Porcisia hertigi]|uniref:Uncharacterized protein n=1 Tax=Porcisia hertigi TaxID=2761500 RepID=A0A836KYF5_9TRYP|nr:hypothetical protein JKF63_00552 [Porcisia hertigi]